ncbi:DUF1206 domain-containing protein [Mangrovicoccus ximenensis]|uniref:DUF1206 domain-containing protein n=1 Tax=Mangrovicoccus ximenensis TaxID=1911570 RepID=UPI000D37FDCB|nr:DUF1206 domain-containing protein [Mangrovicoccus ximenensis]
MAERAPAWVEYVMRAGYAARGVVYLLTGGLALLSAWHGGSGEDKKGALSSLFGQPFGEVIILAIAAGLFCYGIWRLICGYMDLEDEGSETKGLVARVGQGVSGLANLGLSFSIARLALGNGSGGDGKEALTSKLLAMPFGQIIVGAVGLTVIGAGLAYLHKGWSEKYRENLRWSPILEKLSLPIRLGLMARGMVVAIIGGFFIFAAVQSDPDQAGGLSQAFDLLRSQAYGLYLLGFVAFGMLAFGIYCWIEVAFRVLPTRQRKGTLTIAQHLKMHA